MNISKLLAKLQPKSKQLRNTLAVILFASFLLTPIIARYVDFPDLTQARARKPISTPKPASPQSTLQKSPLDEAARLKEKLQFGTELENFRGAIEGYDPNKVYILDVFQPFVKSETLYEVVHVEVSDDFRRLPKIEQQLIAENLYNSWKKYQGRQVIFRLVNGHNEELTKIEWGRIKLKD